VPSRYTVQVSNPALEDLSSLYWEFSGPTAINYILTDNSVARDASDKLFLAGVLGALAAGFFVEFLKTCFELRSDVADVREKREILKQKEDEKKEREKDRAEQQREREKDREALTRIITDHRVERPDLDLATLNRWLVSMFKRPR
jgi:hypothetical protein